MARYKGNYQGNSANFGVSRFQRRISLPSASKRMNVGVSFTLIFSAYFLFISEMVFSLTTRPVLQFFAIPLTAGIWKLQENP